MSSLRLDWATHEAARYACEHWHYSKCVPAGKLIKIGVWENNIFIGVVIFSRGASPLLMQRYGLTQIQGCELTRIALTKHKSPVSKILSIAINFLKKFCEGLKIIISFADPEHGHHGGIYQATNWIYTGISPSVKEIYVDGKWRHWRGAFYNRKNKPVRKRLGKHRYIFILDEKYRDKVLSLKEPYPKRAVSKDNVVLANHAKEGGAIPTTALQNV